MSNYYSPSKAFQKIMFLVNTTGDMSYFFNTHARLEESYKKARTHLGKTRTKRLLIEMRNHCPI